VRYTRQRREKREIAVAAGWRCKASITSKDVRFESQISLHLTQKAEKRAVAGERGIRKLLSRPI
jgi:hypothetical protein